MEIREPNMKEIDEKIEKFKAILEGISVAKAMDLLTWMMIETSANAITQIMEREHCSMDDAFEKTLGFVSMETDKMFATMHEAMKKYKQTSNRNGKYDVQ